MTMEDVDVRDLRYEDEVCIVIPVRNGGEYLRVCLASVVAQDYPKESTVVCIHDDGSTDVKVRDVLEEFEVVMDREGYG